MPVDLSNVSPIYFVLPALLVVGMLTRRVPVVGTIVSLATWAALLALLAVVLGQQDRVPGLSRVADALRLEGQDVVGREVRIRMSPDGHFWARARIGGLERRMLIDSGATVTALSPVTAVAAGLAVRDPVVPTILRTANGNVRAQVATIPELTVGNVTARGVDVVVSPGLGDVDVIGMNLLSRLQSWRVEGRTLVLVPHHPQPVRR